MTGGYQHTVTRLDNGLPVVAVSAPHLHSAAVGVFARIGSRHETSETNGLSHFLEHMFFRGCDGFSDSASLNDAIEDLGGILDGFTTRDHSGYQVMVHPDFALDAAEIFGRIFTSPSFKDIEIERSVILEEILDSEDDRGRIVELDTLAHRESFRGHSLSQSIDGSKRNLRRFNTSDLNQHRRRYYGGRNLVLCFAGKIDVKKCRAAAARALAQLFPGSLARETPPKLPHAAPRFAYVRSDDARTRVRLSFRTVSETHKDYAAVSLLRRIIDGGLSGRLQVELVEKRGIAYEVGADLETYVDCGLFDFEFAVAHAKLGLAFDELAKLIRDLRTHLVPPAELLRIRRRARIGLELGLDSSLELNHWFATNQLFGNPITLEARLAAMDAVTAERIAAAVDHYFRPDRLTVAAVGGADKATVRAARKAVQRFVESF